MRFLHVFLVPNKKPLSPEVLTLKRSQIFGRPSDRLTDAQLRQAVKILTHDMARQGKIKLSACPRHGQKYLTYRYQVGDGVRVFCSCGWTTHFNEYNYHKYPVILDAKCGYLTSERT